ncbi:DEAD/DEAH box helicase [Pedobacter miscanthi]|uniref:DEAD/DEAH box helicase n=1 Tax=Pedobacter miscanthi TaxID=2259170 RepID=UPI00293011A8|nr:DEAD/DEAH box helicase [Pedobacter miscanthi]
MIELLSAPIRRYIRDKRWESLRPIQSHAIAHIIQSDKHIILSSKTASGKTEAAFLPMLSKLDYTRRGVKILYVSPLIALINDQFNRIEELCEYLEVPVTKWHGEAKRSAKEALLKSPDGVVLITPESIEAMLVNAPQNAAELFGELQYLVIDEIHSFIGTDRGTQLASLISRLGQINKTGFRVIGLSATIGAVAEAKKLTGHPEHTTLLKDKAKREMDISFKYYKIEGVELPLDLLKDLYLEVKDSKVLIFPNSRGRAEEVAVKLKKISGRVKGHTNYFSHHSSVDRELREYIEQFAKTNTRYPFAISCTSTLELGIDIGSVEKVVQIDAAHSIASLIQRVGRSGRRDGEKSSLISYATDEWNLTQSLACIELFREDFIEPMHAAEKPYDLLLHQILSIVKQYNGRTIDQLKDLVAVNFAFANISPEEIHYIIKGLLEHEQLEQIGLELIIGVEGERTVNTKDFYSVFRTDPSFKIIHQDKTIGELPLMSSLQIDENILLAAKIWKIQEIDYRASKVFVIPAKDGKKPIFFGTGGEVHPKIREKMLEILCVGRYNNYPELSEEAQEALRLLQLEFRSFSIQDIRIDRPLMAKHLESIFYAFQGTKINRSINFLLSLKNIEVEYHEHDSSFIFKTSPSQVITIIKTLSATPEEIDCQIDRLLQNNPTVMEFSKWGKYLPLDYQRFLLKSKVYDFEGAQNFLQSCSLIIATEKQ